MQPIAYAAPTSVAECIALLQQYGARARLLAGGTDLIPQLREHAREADVVIDGKRVPELGRLRVDPATGLTLGAAVPCFRLGEDPDICRLFPGLVDAASLIGGTAIQSRASVGGNLCNSGPAADTIPALIAYGAVARIVGPLGERTAPVEEFCTGPGRNILGLDELLVSLHLPTPAPRSGGRYLRFIPRNEMDIAEASAGVCVTLDATGAIAAARIALGAVAPTPLFVREAGDALIGAQPTDEALARAAGIAAAAARPITDMRGTEAHRKQLVTVLTHRALRAAVERAGQT